MISVPRRHYRPLVVALALALSGWVGWEAAVSNTDRAADIRVPDPWGLPETMEWPVEETLARLRMRSPWTGAAESVVQGQDAPQTVQGGQAWRLAGIVLRDGDFAALVQLADGNREVVLRRIGDSLPDGRVIERLTPDTLTAGADGVISSVRLYSVDQ